MKWNWDNKGLDLEDIHPDFVRDMKDAGLSDVDDIVKKVDVRKIADNIYKVSISFYNNYYPFKWQLDLNSIEVLYNNNKKNTISLAFKEMEIIKDYIPENTSECIVKTIFWNELVLEPENKEEEMILHKESKELGFLKTDYGLDIIYNIGGNI